MALTYQQDQKKINTTIRLKRISQRFNTGYKAIRMLKEDYLGTLSARIPRRHNLLVKEYKYPLPYNVPRVKPSNKWNMVSSLGSKAMALRSEIERTSFSFVATQEVKSNKQNQNTTFVLSEARDLDTKQTEFPKNDFKIAGLFFKLWHLNQEFIGTTNSRSLAALRTKKIREIRAKESHIKESISYIKSQLKYLYKKLQRGFRHPVWWRNKKEIETKKRNECLKEIGQNKYNLKQLYWDLEKACRPKFAIKGPYWYRKKNRTLYQIAVFDYRRLQKVKPKKLIRFPQSNYLANISEYEEPSWYNLQNLHRKSKQYYREISRLSNKDTLYKIGIFPDMIKAIMFNKMVNLMWLTPSFQYKDGIYKNMKTNEIIDNKIIDKLSYWDSYFGHLRKKVYTEKFSFNIANFNTKSTQVLYRYMQILRDKFGVYQADLPFRIDNYMKAYEKKRPTKHKQMCLARAKIRLFYGQLTVEKLGRLLRKTKASFPHMFGAMERRLDILLVRANFCKNIFTAQQIVKAGHILVNNKTQRNCYHSIRCYDYVTFKSKQLETFCKHLILTKLRLNRFKYPLVSYLVVNYKLMYWYVRPITDARRQVGFSAPMSHSYLSKY